MTNEQLTQFKRLHSVLHTAELSGDTDNTSARSVLSRTLHCCLLRYYTHSLRKPAQPGMAMLPLSCGLAGVNRSAMSPLLLAQTVSRNARAGTRKAARIFRFRFIVSRSFCISPHRAAHSQEPHRHSAGQKRISSENFCHPCK